MAKRIFLHQTCNFLWAWHEIHCPLVKFASFVMPLCSQCMFCVKVCAEFMLALVRHIQLQTSPLPVSPFLFEISFPYEGVACLYKAQTQVSDWICDKFTYVHSLRKPTPADCDEGGTCEPREWSVVLLELVLSGKLDVHCATMVHANGILVQFRTCHRT